MKPTVVFVHVSGNPDFYDWSLQFLASYENAPPGHDHDTVVVFNGKPSDEERDMFKILPNVSFFYHDNTGSDIGAYQAVSRELRCELAVYFGTTSYVQAPHWLAHMVYASSRHGRGMYGSLASYEISPHLATTGFWCHPSLVAEYPHPVITKSDRYDFEHGPRAFWRHVQRRGLPALLVTWDGEYDWRDWRKPPNIYRRGNQGNCLTFYRHSTNFGLASPANQAIMAHSADTLVDPFFIGNQTLKV